MIHKFTILKTSDIERHLDLKEVFKDCAHKTWQTNEAGYLVDIDLCQQVALAKALSKKTGVKIGLPNFKASGLISDILIAERFIKKTSVHWIWTGERYDEPLCPEVNFYLPENLDGRFLYRYIDHESWYDNAPDHRHDFGGVVFGGCKTEFSALDLDPSCTFEIELPDHIPEPGKMAEPKSIGDKPASEMTMREHIAATIFAKYEHFLPDKHEDFYKERMDGIRSKVKESIVLSDIFIAELSKEKPR